ncbi:hypothetical protein TCAL_15102 [Tigriopus californicus]|uniref:V-type proton ATPase subunit F n=1 Tax=Tigriopus californicus TaxID=6832 RepID=A0A553NTE5_TIGCA|nr:hypothetical protein TCAL_15102 [Tigriopus californicus]
MALHAAKGKLIGVIGDEDTCVGFLLGGIGEMNKNRHPNFMVVDKSKFEFCTVLIISSGAGVHYRSSLQHSLVLVTGDNENCSAIISFRTERIERIG